MSRLPSVEVRCREAGVKPFSAGAEGTLVANPTRVNNLESLACVYVEGSRKFTDQLFIATPVGSPHAKAYPGAYSVACIGNLFIGTAALRKRASMRGKFRCDEHNPI